MMVGLLKKQIAQYSENYLTIIAVIVTHFVGAIGISSTWRDFFLTITPLHLLLVYFLLLKGQEKISASFLIFMATVMTASILIEIVGVNTGEIFGAYSYGNTLGIQIENTPLLIGILWFTLIYSIGVMLSNWKINNLIKSLIGACLMVLIDLFIEPAAIDLGFWAWENNRIPLQNYMAWFIISFGLLIMFFTIPFDKKNQVAPVIYWSQLLFFIIIYVI